MRAAPQPADYRPDPRLLAIAEWLADPVQPECFFQQVRGMATASAGTQEIIG